LAAGKTMATLTHDKKSVRAIAIHPTEYSFATGSAGGNNIKKCRGCLFLQLRRPQPDHQYIIALSVNAEGVYFSGGMRLFIYSAECRHG
jgi:pleiotropic regulator 1